MNNKSIIFGLGQDSWFLSNLLLERGDKVLGCHRHTYVSGQFNDFPTDKMDLAYCDMNDASSVSHLISYYQPDEIYNLAAHSFVGESFDKPAQVVSNNIVSHINVLEAVRRGSPLSKIYYAGSSEEIANGVSPITPYGVSKDAVRRLNDIYRESYGTFICHAQNYNHSSWRHSDQFFFAKVAKYVATLSKWLAHHEIICTEGPMIQGKVRDRSYSFSWLPKLTVGNLEGYRDISYAKDVMRAAVLMMSQENSGVYPVCTGILTKMEHLIRWAFWDALKLDYKNFTEINNSFKRPTGSEAVPEVEKCTKLRNLGWFPTLESRDLMEVTIIEYLRRGLV